MYPITVLKNTNNDSTELVTINLSEVLFISNEGSRLVFHTLEDRYYQITSIQELEQHLKDVSFEKLDRPFLVNMNKIRDVDKDQRLVYFEDDTYEDRKFVTVAKVKLDLLNMYLR